MALKYTGTGVFKYGLDVQGQFPLDSRIVVSAAADLTNFKELFVSGGVPTWYPGMVVFAEDTKKIYVLQSEADGFAPVGADESQLANLFTYKASVADLTKLPTTGMKVGDVYNVETEFIIGELEDAKKYPAGTNVVWNGTSWDTLGGSVDLSNYATKTEAQTYANNAAAPAAAAASAAQSTANDALALAEAAVPAKEGFDLISDTDLAKIGTNETAIGEIQSKLSGVDFGSIENRLQSVESVSGQNKTDISGHKTRIEALETEVNTQGQAISGFQAKVGQIDTNAANITNLQGRVSTLEGAVENLNKKECNVKDVSATDKVLSLTDGIVSSSLDLQYDKENKKIKLIGKDANNPIATIATDDFVKDGMISSVTYANKTLTITWNTDSDKTPNVTTIPLTDLVDQYSAGAGVSITNNTIKVELSTEADNMLSMKDNKLYMTLEWEEVE